MRRYLLFVWILMLLCSYSLPVYANAQETKEVPPELKSLYATSAVLMDGDSGRVLFEKNAHEIRAMASTTKIMTCIIGLENGKLDDMVTISAYAASMPKVKLGAKAGETFYLRDLLYSLMLESHNDTAVAVAEHIAGSVEDFAKLMNQKAERIGCADTYFITPNGLDSSEIIAGETKMHATTAVDLANILRYCIKESSQREKFLEITRTLNHTFTDTQANQTFSCSNHNAFLRMMDGALTGKTGFTGNAGYCYVGALKKDGKTFIAALLACGWPNHKSYKWSDMQTLMKYGLEHYEYRLFADLTLDQEKLRPLLAREGQTSQIGKAAFEELEIVKENQNMPKGMLVRADEKMEVVYDLPDELLAPLKRGDFIGKLKFLVEGEVWSESKVLAKQDIEKINYQWCLNRILERFTLT